MILVTLGTQDKQFTRLIKLVEDEVIKKNITDKVVVQSGNTKYDSAYLDIFDFVPDIDKYVDECDLLITHGGVGSIMSAIKKGKNVIAVPRLKKYNEHTNDHQLQICMEYEKKGYIKVLNDGEELSTILKDIKKFKPKEFISNTKNIIDYIENYIDNI